MKLKFAALAFAVILSAPANAQVGSTTDILMGRIAGLDSQAVANARVEATSLETGITRTKTTGADGRYTILFPDGGGSYRLTVRALGMAPVTRNISRQGDEDRIITDFDMGRTASRRSIAASRARKHGAKPQSESHQPAAGGCWRSHCSCRARARRNLGARDGYNEGLFLGGGSAGESEQHHARRFELWGG
jgi:hypothetical protein